MQGEVLDFEWTVRLVSLRVLGPLGFFHTFLYPSKYYANLYKNKLPSATSQDRFRTVRIASRTSLAESSYKQSK